MTNKQYSFKGLLKANKQSFYVFSWTDSVLRDLDNKIGEANDMIDSVPVEGVSFIANYAILCRFYQIKAALIGYDGAVERMIAIDDGDKKYAMSRLLK